MKSIKAQGDERWASLHTGIWNEMKSCMFGLGMQISKQFDNVLYFLVVFRFISLVMCPAAYTIVTCQS